MEERRIVVKTVEHLTRLRKRIISIRRQLAEAKARMSHLKTILVRDYKCASYREAEKMLKSQVTREKKLRKRVERAVGAFESQWNSQLELLE
jgi:5-bromo-4-chloroindolyl phosphate hydrolysis protein